LRRRLRQRAWRRTDEPLSDQAVVPLVAFPGAVFSQVVIAPGDPDNGKVFGPVMAVFRDSGVVFWHECGFLSVPK